MRALITGMAGFVGSHLAEYLLENTDWEIWGAVRIDNAMDNLAGLMPRINAGDRVHLVYFDLTEAGSVDNIVKTARPDYVFHLAAQSYPATSFTAPAETVQTNTIGTLNLLRSIRDHAPQAWVHVCSSSEVYGQVSQKDLPITESCAFNPASPYSISKVGADLFGQFHARAYGLNTITTRMFTHTGPRRGDVFAESTFAKQIAMIEAGQLEPPVKVGNLQSLRTIADVRDAVRAYHMALTINPQRGEVYNIGGNHTCTVGEILDTLFEVAGHGFDVEVDPARLRPIDADLQVPDCSKFMNHTGWEPEIPFEQTMTDLLEYWREKVKHGIPLQR